MKRKHQRLMFISFAVLGLGAAVLLVMSALEDSIVYFHSPTDVVEKKLDLGRSIRIGGIVVEESVKKKDDGLTTTFEITDLANNVPVVYTGILPDLFREGQGVVAEGKLSDDGVFTASEVLAKHDENYMAPEVADALKKSGRWGETSGQEKPK